MQKHLIVNPVFEKLIRPLTTEEFSELETSILRDGCLSPIALWGETILDGHNRYKICNKNEIKFDTVRINVSDEEDAKNWIDRNQLARRNLSPEQISLIRGRIYNRTKKAAHGRADRDFWGYHDDPPKRTAELIAEQEGVSAPTIKRDGKYAEAVDTLKEIVPDIEEQLISGEKLSKSGIVEAAKILKPHIAHNSGDNEWYTPEEYIDAAKSVMETIHLDPASCEIANKVVGAETFFSAEDDGLTKDWFGNVWMNPPYAQPTIKNFCEKLAEQFLKRNVKQACVLVNNATETVWFQDLAKHSSAICFPRGRIKFWAPEKKIATPLQGQAILYLGDNPSVFISAFVPFGICYSTKE